MPTRKLSTLIAILVAFAGLTTAAASAADPGGTPKTADATWDLAVTSTDLTNTRVINLFTVSPGTTSLDSALAVEVTETQAVSDGQPWSLTVSADDFAEWNATDGFVTGGKTVGCENGTMTPTDPGGLISLSSTLASAGVTQTYGSTSAFARDTDNSSARDCDGVTLFTVSGQDADVAYTNVYSGGATLSATVPESGLLDTTITYRTTVTATLVE